MITSPGTRRKATHYHANIKGKIANHQNTTVLTTMQELGQPTNARMLMKAVNGRGYKIDLVSLRRCLTNLSKPGPKGNWLNQWGRAMIREAYERPCPITKVTVGWYELIPAHNQLDIFSQSPNA